MTQTPPGGRVARGPRYPPRPGPRGAPQESKYIHTLFRDCITKIYIKIEEHTFLKCFSAVSYIYILHLYMKLTYQEEKIASSRTGLYKLQVLNFSVESHRNKICEGNQSPLSEKINVHYGRCGECVGGGAPQAPEETPPRQPYVDSSQALFPKTCKTIKINK